MIPIFLSIGFSFLYAVVIVIHRRRIHKPDFDLPCYPKVSVLLTLRNLDDGLEENLSSVFSIHYPNYDLFFAVDGMEDPCIPVLERVRSRFPNIRSTVVVTGHSSLNNPKISKLAKLESRSDAELFWVLDSDIRVTPQTLQALVGEYLYKDARIVFCPIRCRGASTFGSVLEMSYINFFLSGSILTAWKFFKQRVIVGKSLLIERQALEHFGGFDYFTDVLAEDHWLGEAFAQGGFAVNCNYTWVDNIKEKSTVKNYFARITRWAKLRYNLKRPIYLFEILLNPPALILILLPILKITALPLALVVIMVRIIMEYIVFFTINDSDRVRLPIILSLAPAVLCKDLLMLVAYFMPFFSHNISWRGGNIRIGKYTLIGFYQENCLYDGA